RDRNVTGVQTCALPISEVDDMNFTLQQLNLCDQLGSNSVSRSLYCYEEGVPAWEEVVAEDDNIPQLDGMDDTPEVARGKKARQRSEERRVGKECGPRRA